jgi:hypothetical protein
MIEMNMVQVYQGWVIAYYLGTGGSISEVTPHRKALRCKKKSVYYFRNWLHSYQLSALTEHYL